MNSTRKLAILTVLLWSAGQTLGRLISLRSVFPLFALVFSFSFIVFVVYSARTDDRPLRIKLGDVKPSFFLFGSMGYFFYWFGMSESYRSYASPSEPIVLNYTWLIFTVLFTELFFRRQGSNKSAAARLVEVVGLGCGFFSTLVMASQGNLFPLHIVNITGLLWGLFGGASYGLFGAFSSTVSRQQQPVFLMCSAAVGIAGMTVLSLSNLSDIARISSTDLLVVLLLGVAVDGLGYVVWTRVNRLAKETGVSIAPITSLVFLLPVTSLAVSGVVFNGYTFLRPYFLVVILLLVAGTVLCHQGVAALTPKERSDFLAVEYGAADSHSQA